MTNLIDEILNNFEQEIADKKALEQQKALEKRMFLEAWAHIKLKVIAVAMEQFGAQLRNHRHHISFQRKTPPGYHQTEDSYSIEISESTLSCRLYFFISMAEREAIVIRHYGYRSRNRLSETPEPSKIPLPISETRHPITDITHEFLEALVAEGLKTLLYATAR